MAKITPYNDPTNSNPEMDDYFDTLPAFFKETIKQSKNDVDDKDELKSIADNLMEYDK